MIVSCERRAFVPLGASALMTADGEAVGWADPVFVRDARLNGRTVSRVYLGDALVYETPRSYFYIHYIQ